jgi:hypothetical protein
MIIPEIESIYGMVTARRTRLLALALCDESLDWQLVFLEDTS